MAAGPLPAATGVPPARNVPSLLPCRNTTLRASATNRSGVRSLSKSPTARAVGIVPIGLFGPALNVPLELPNSTGATWFVFAVIRSRKPSGGPAGDPTSATARALTYKVVSIEPGNIYFGAPRNTGD